MHNSITKNESKIETTTHDNVEFTSKRNVNNVSTICHLNETAELIVNIDDLTKINNHTTTLTKLLPLKKCKKNNNPKPKRTIYTCDICLAKIPKKRNLIPHMSSHINISQPLKLSCNICIEKFPTTNDLELHIITKHGDEKKISKEIVVLDANENDDEELHKCDICGKCFAWNHQLQYHKNIHRDNKPVSCEVCSKKYTSISLLRKHLQLHNILIHHCTSCKTAKFQTLKELRLHRTNCGNIIDDSKMVACGNCGRKFRSVMGLNAHKKACKQNGKYEYFCIKCGRKFLTQNGLNVHNVQSHK